MVSSPPQAPATQNTVRGPAMSCRKPASGIPSVVPMPSVALNPPIAVPILSGGRVSLRMLIATGTSAVAKPWSDRPAISAGKVPRSAMNEPAVITDMAMTSIRRRPTMSASRVTTGVATAATSKVDVTSQDASSGLTP